MATHPPPPPPPRPPIKEGADDRGDDQAPGPNDNHIVMPEDGYEWKKYGQKYIIKIGKNRSYFKCRKQNCSVKKRAEWPPNDPGNMRIVYHEGVHNHRPRPTSSDQEASGSSSAPNPYDLRAQVFGDQPDEPS